MEKVIDLAELGKSIGELPGGAAVLCLAHDCLVEEEGELEGFVRSELLHSATAALVALRRGMRAQKELATATNACPDGGVQATRLSGVGGVQETRFSESGGVQATRLSAAAGGSIGSMLHQAIANIETRAELDVFEDEVCADLCRIFSSRSADGNATVGASQIPYVRAALQKHKSLLSPQSVCALTALLSARGQSLAHNSREDSTGGSLNDSLSAGNPADWKPVVSDALLAVRKASLEHVVMWARTCDPANVEAACNTHVSDVAAGAAPAVCGAEGVDGDAESTWAALHKASGLGLSPLMLVTATLCPCDTTRSIGSDGNDGDRKVSTADAAHGGDTSRGGVVFSTSSTVRSVVRLLSSEYLDNLFYHLSQCQAEAITKGNSGAESGSFRSDGRKVGAPEILSNFPGHQAIEHLSRIDSETLKNEALEAIALLDARCTGALPPAAVITSLQCGKAGFCLNSLQAQLVLQLAGGFLLILSDERHLYSQWMLPSLRFSPRK